MVNILRTFMKAEGTTNWELHLQVVTLSRRHTWRFYSPIAANLIASDFRHRPDADTLGDFFANRGDVALQPCSQTPSATFILYFEKSCDKIAQPDWLTLLAIRGDVRKKSRERAH